MLHLSGRLAREIARPSAVVKVAGVLAKPGFTKTRPPSPTSTAAQRTYSQPRRAPSSTRGADGHDAGVSEAISLLHDIRGVPLDAPTATATEAPFRRDFTGVQIGTHVVFAPRNVRR